MPPPPRSPLFPYTTLFRSAGPRGLRPLGQADRRRLVLVQPPRRSGGDAARGPRHPRRDVRGARLGRADRAPADRKSTRLNSSHTVISYAVFCLKKKRRTMFTFELLVPPEKAQLDKLKGDNKAYDLELRPRLMVKTIQYLQNAHVEQDV